MLDRRLGFLALVPLAAAGMTRFLPVSSGPYLVTAADINRDGYPDALLACRGDLKMPSEARPGNDKLTVYLTNGSPEPSIRKDYDVGFGPYAAEAADLDADGRPDVVVANFQANDGRHMSVLWGRDGADPLSPAVHWTLEGAPFAYDKNRDAAGAPVYPTPGITSVTIADVDRDGRPDIIAVAWSSDFFTVFRNLGKRRFSQRRYELPPGPRDVAAADFDGDGRLDLAFTIYSSNLVEVWAGDGKGGFKRRSTFLSQGHIPYDIKAADLDQDGRIDLVVGNRGVSDNVAIWRNEPEGFRYFGSVSPDTPRHGENTEDEIRDVLVHDINGDGIPDLLAACHRSHKVSAWLGTGERKFGKLFVRHKEWEFPGKGSRALAMFGGKLGIAFYEAAEFGVMDLQ